MVVGLACLSAGLGRRVYLWRGYYNLYTNLYVLLLSESASTRKSIAVKIGVDLITVSCNIGVFAQKGSPQSLVKFMNEQYNKTGSSAVLLFADELINFIEKDSITLLGFITKFYDCPDKWVYTTLDRGNEELKNVWCTSIFAATPEWLRMAIPSIAIGGGFTSRLLMVHESATLKRIPRPEKHITEEISTLRENLINDLREISKIEGTFRWDKEAGDWYDDWYMTVYNPDMGEYGMGGYYGRKHDTLLKLAMLYHISRDDELVIEVEDLEQALSTLNVFEKRVPVVIEKIQTTEVGDNINRVMGVIEKKGEIEHSVLLRKVSYFANAKQVADIIETLVGQKRIEVCNVKGKMMYKMMKK
jgi:hypothetical protein